MKYSKSLPILLVHLLCGFAVVLLTSLLIYFKQKPVLHHFAVLLCVATVYFAYFNLQKNIKQISNYISFSGLAVLIFACWFAPQFIYQVRPYTFYISGFTIAFIILIAIPSVTLGHKKELSYFWNPLFFVAGYIFGFFMQTSILQILVMVSLFLFLILFVLISNPTTTQKIGLVSVYLVCALAYWQFSVPIVYHPEQKDYEDKVLFASQTQHHKLVITQWQQDHWFYIDKLKNLSSIDEYLYYEPMVHPVIQLADDVKEVLVIGGENGCLIKEILKYPEVSSIQTISYDTLLRNLAMENTYFTSMNHDAYRDKKVTIIHEDLLSFVADATQKYDVIFVDLPDPRSVETNQYYTIEFYSLIRKLLYEDGLMVTQAGSPYFAMEAFYAIGQTIQHAGFYTQPIHNQILTLGEWGWYICSLNMKGEMMKKRMVEENEIPVTTKWWSHEAAQLVTSFGKTYEDTLHVQINTLENPLVYQYYLKGTWDMN